MAEVRLYYQERADGGRRSGLYVEGSALLGGFVPGIEEPDPRLLWYIDLVWETPSAPRTAATASGWLEDRSDDIREVLERTADELGAGLDVDLVPWRWECPTGGGPVRVSVSAQRRFAAVDVGRRIRRLAASWAGLRPALTAAG